MSAIAYAYARVMKTAAKKKNIKQVGNISHFIFFFEHLPDEMNYVWHKFYLKIGTRHRIHLTVDGKIYLHRKPDPVVFELD